MIFIKFSLCLVLLFSVFDRANGSNISEKMKIEPVKSFTVVELWNSLKPISHSVESMSMTYSLINSETPVMVGKWRQCAFVMVGGGDLGTIPVAFRIWTKEQCSVEFKKSDSGAIRETTDFQLMVNADLPVKVSVSKRLDVTANGAMLGRIRTIYD